MFSNSLTDLEILSVHIPKTAGSTFGHIFLKRIYTHNQMFYDYEFLSLEETLLKIPPSTAVIHGHFPAIKYVHSFPIDKYKYIVWLRHPLHQLISWYFFWLAPPNGQIFDNAHKRFLEDKLSFEDFIEMPYAINSYSYYLQGLNIEDFYFIGLQEFFSEDLNYLKNILGYPQIETPNIANSNEYPEYKDAKRGILENVDVVNRIKRLNFMDMSLYQKASEIRKNRSS